MTEDSALVQRYVEQNDEAAFAEFVRRHLNLVYFAAWRRTGGNSALAEDIAQKVFVAAARQAKSLAAHTTVSGWLYTTTRNIASRVLRAEGVRRRSEQELLAMHEPASPEPQPDWGRVRPFIDAALDELSHADREALLLRYFEQQPFARIGAVLHVSENTARMRVERALDKLRLRLAARGLVSTSVALGTALGIEAARVAPAALTASVVGAAINAGTAGVLGGFGWLGFMSTGKAIGVAAAATALSIGGSVFLIRAERAAQHALAAARQENAAVETRLREAERQAGLLPQSVAAPPRAAAVSKPVGSPSSPAADPKELGNAVLDRNPGFRALFKASAQANIAGRYFPLYRELGLTPAAIAEFEEIMLGDAGGSTHYNFPGLGTVQFNVAAKLPADEKDRRLREVLGEEGVTRMKEYQRSLSSYVSRLAGALYCTDTPLTVEQGRELGRVIAEQSARVVRGRMTPGEFWEPIVTRAGAFLSTPQLRAVAGLRARDEFMWAQDRAVNARK